VALGGRWGGRQFSDGRYAEVCGAVERAPVDLGEFVFGSGETDLESFDLTQPVRVFYCPVPQVEGLARIFLPRAIHLSEALSLLDTSWRAFLRARLMVCWPAISAMSTRSSSSVCTYQLSGIKLGAEKA
jgi:hypothetical protein